MDYVVGSVAALITGNVTPNRPRLMKRALTPTKHQPSPNVTPKSEFVEDRSIFLSPTMQKKKAIVKKSPKRIFENPDLDTTEMSEGNLTLTSPKADKVKKHLKDELEGDSMLNKSVTKSKSPKNKTKNNSEYISLKESDKSLTEQDVNEHTPKKKKKKISGIIENLVTQPVEEVSTEDVTTTKSPKKRKERRKSVVDIDTNKENDNITETVYKPAEDPTKQKTKTNNPDAPKDGNSVTEISTNNTPKKKNKKRKKKPKAKTNQEDADKKENIVEDTNKENIEQENKKTRKKKNRRSKKSKGQQNVQEKMEVDKETENKDENDSLEEKTESKDTVNPNAITDKESDSEHESDNEIESENEEINKKVLEPKESEESSDEENEEPNKAEKKVVEKKEGTGEEKMTEDEIKRTLFVGNVPFSVKCKKEIKKIFNKHGQIETIRIRTVPIKDGRYTPKLALIKNELHPERTTVNVYIKYTDADSVEKALVENNSLLNEHHLRVSRSSSTGAEHDPRCSVFIGNLPFAMEDEALRTKFEKCGMIHSVRIIRDKKTNAGKGFGYVNFESKDGVELALALTEEDLTVKNRILRVKRCTQVTNKKKPVKTGNNQAQQQRRFAPGNNPRGGFAPGNNQHRGNFAPGNNQHRGNFAPGNNQYRGGNNQQRGRFAPGNDQVNQRGGYNKFGNQGNQGQKDEEGREGAFRRIMHKRKNQEGTNGDEPPNKRQNINQPNKEKKTRKEFVGMTAEKKKKRKFDKGQKKKKALSEILTK